MSSKDYDLNFSDAVWEFSSLRNKGIFTEKLQSSIVVSDSLLTLVNSYKGVMGLDKNATAKDVYYKLQEILDNSILEKKQG